MLGSSKLQPKASSWARKIRVGDIVLHPKYWGRNFFRNDIALLHLDIPVTYNKYVQPICLPDYNFNLKVGTQCWVTGWGQSKKHSSGKLDGFGDVPLGLCCPIPGGAFEEAMAVVSSLRFGVCDTATVHTGAAVRLTLLGLGGHNYLPRTETRS